MNHKLDQPKVSEQKKAMRPSLQTGVEQSDSKEILFLAAGLITLTLGLGGLFMYSDDEPLPLTASQEAAEEVSSFEMSKAFANPTSSSTIPISAEPASSFISEPSLQLVANPHTSQETQDMDVHFGFNLWILSNEAKDLIKTNVEAQGKDWTGTFHINGHTDALGPDSYNQALGLKRAESVKTYLVSLGIADDRIQTQSFGKDGAICQEETPACFEDNRRAHIAFLNLPSVQQDDILLSMTPDVFEDSTPQSSTVVVDSLSTKGVEEEIALQEETLGELVAVEPIASAESHP